MYSVARASYSGEARVVLFQRADETGPVLHEPLDAVEQAGHALEELPYRRLALMKRALPDGLGVRRALRAAMRLPSAIQAEVQGIPHRLSQLPLPLQRLIEAEPEALKRARLIRSDGGRDGRF
jgi:hypothetical protein